MARGEYPTNVAVHIGANQQRRDKLDEFDAAVRPAADPPYSRSDELLRSMEYRILIEETFERFGFDDLDADAKRGALRQALVDHLREEAERAGEE